MERRVLLKLFAFGSAISSLSFFSAASEAQEPKKGGTLVMIVQPEPPSLAGYLSTSQPIGQITTKVYEGLLEYDFDLKPLPALAKSWDVSSDGKTITFELQQGVKFHDGNPFTSADVKFTFLEILKKFHPRGINTFADLQSIDTPDAHTAIFRLRNPAPYLLSALSGYESPIVPRHLFEGKDVQNSEYGNKPVGTGPFKFAGWQKGQLIRLDRNPEYWKPGRPYLDRIVARFIGDAGTRAAALETGEAHFAAFGAIPNVDVPRLQQLPNFVVTTKGYEMLSPIIHLEFNTLRKPFDNQQVRQAVAYAIDRKFVIDNIWFGFGKPATGPISSNLESTGLYTANVKNYDVPNRLEIANKLLDEAGMLPNADGVRFEITHDIQPYGEEWKRFGEYVQQALAKVGIKVVLRYEDVPTWLRRIFTHYDFDMTSDLILTLPDPVLGVHRMYSSKMIKPGTVFVNDTHWSTPRTDQLMDQASVSSDNAERVKLYHEFQKLVVEASPIVWVSELQWATIHAKKFKDVIIGGLGVYESFDRAWLEK